MAYSVSSRFHEVSYSGGAQYTCTLKINGATIDPSQISSIVFSRPIIDSTNEGFYIGTFISNQVKIKFKNALQLSLQSGQEVEISISLKVDNTDVSVPMGKFIIDTLAENYYKTNEITCLDYACNMLTPINYENAIYSYELTEDTEIDTTKSYYTRAGSTWKDYVYTIVKEPVATELSNYYERTTSYIEMEDLLQWICNYYDVTLGTYPNVNRNVKIYNYDSTISGKAYISYIAELMGGNAKFDRTGTLNIVPIYDTSVTQIEINAKKGKSWELGERYKVSQVQYFDGIRNFTYPNAGDTSYNTLNIRQDNLFVNSLAVDEENPNPLVNSIINNVGAAVVGLDIYSASAENFGDISLDDWDIIKYKVDSNYYNVINNDTLTYEITIMSKVDAQIPSKQVQSTTNIIGTTENKIRKVFSEIDNANNRITLNAQNTYTKEQIRKIAKGDSLDDETVQVSYVATEQGIFSDEGLRIQKENQDRTEIISKTSSLFNEVGVTVQKVSDGEVSSEKPILFSGYVDEDNENYEDYEGQSITATQNLVVDKFTVLGSRSRIQEYSDTVSGHTVNKTGMFPLE